MSSRTRLLVAAAGPLVAAGLGACAADAERLDPLDEPYAGPALPWAYAPFPAVVYPLDNLPSPERAELGRLLFYDPILSRDRATACATCHSEIWGLSDGLPVSIGVDGEGPTGPGRVGEHKTTRNAQTLWNVRYREALFWDGRTVGLEAQALEPIEAEHELDLRVDEAVARLSEVPEYVARFERAFPGEPPGIDAHKLARALAALQRTFVSDHAPYDQYVDGDEGALSEPSKRGMFLFAEAGCASCHVPPLFESDEFVRRGPTEDVGRMGVTDDPDDRGAFRVPTLRNLRETGPYFHDGSVATLEEAVALEAERSAREGDGRALTAPEVAEVAVFVRKALVDRSREPSRPKQVPSGLEVPIDGFRVPR